MKTPTMRDNSTPKPPVSSKEREKARKLRETQAFKRKYFDYYDDVKISVKEDW